MIKLYALALSSYCTKVRIVLRIKGIPFEEVAPPGGHYSSDEYQSFMPPGSIPSIQQSDFKLFDSEAIVEYLEDISKNPPMLSRDFRIRARQRALAQFHNTAVEPAVRNSFPLARTLATGIDEDLLDNALQQFLNSLDKLESVIEPSPFLGGATPCLADCGFPATLRMGQDIFAYLGKTVSFSGKIENWLEALENHPIIGEEVENNRAAISQWLGSLS